MIKARLNNIFALALILLFTNCQEPIKGCLDARATNFDVTAARACEDNCCLFPNLRLQFNYVFDTFNLTFNRSYLFGTDSVKILSSQFYVSNCQLTKPDGTKATVLDSTFLYRDTDTLSVPSYYALAGKNVGFDFTLGKFNNVGTYSKLSFIVGLDAEAAKTIPRKMPSSHPLSIKADSMYISSQKQYIFHKMNLVRTSKITDTLRLVIITPKPIELTAVRNLVFKDGFDALVPLKVDYKKWLEGVNFNEPINSIQEKIVSNTSKAFLLNQ